MILPGWKKRVRGPIGDIVVISYEDPSSYQDAGGIRIPTRSVAVTESGLTIHIEHLHISTALEAELFSRMILGAWIDATELRAHEETGQKEGDIRIRLRIFTEGFRAALMFVATRVRRFADSLATTDEPSIATWWYRFADALDRELRDSRDVGI